MFLPVLAVERLDDNLLGRLIETANVDVDAIRVRSWDIERLDAARAAEIVLGDTRIERIDAQPIFAGNQLEARFRDDQVQIARFPTDRAVAVLADDRRWCFHFEADGAAVAASRMNHRSRCSSWFWCRVRSSPWQVAKNIAALGVQRRPCKKCKCLPYCSRMSLRTCSRVQPMTS